MTHPSLHRRMLLLVGLPVIVLWVVAGAWLAQRTAHETGEMFDRELQRTAASVLAVVAAMPGGRVGDIGKSMRPRHGTDQRPEIMVRDRDGRLLLDASTLPVEAVRTDAPRFETLRYANESWRVYRRWDASHRYWIQVAAPLHDREQLLSAHIQAMLIPVAALLLLLPLAIWAGLRSGLAPLRRVSRAIARQPAQTPVLTRADVPTELLQLTLALDALVATLNHALARERRFTADAAHELRHPLSVLRMELDLAGVAVDGAARHLHLERARAGLARMERLVTQLLMLARVESIGQLADARPLDAAILARTVVSQAGERAAPRGTVLSLHAEPAWAIASSGLLAIALGNLIGNAIAHGRPRGKVAVSVRAQAELVELAVEDDGRGIPEAIVERAGERFRSGSASRGSGLGLSIVEAIATLHGGALVLSRSSAGGARAALRLPRIDPPTATTAETSAALDSGDPDQLSGALSSPSSAPTPSSKE